MKITKIEDLTSEQINKLSEILDIIEIHTESLNSPYLFYIPLDRFPSSIEKSVLITLAASLKRIEPSFTESELRRIDFEFRISDLDKFKLFKKKVDDLAELSLPLDDDSVKDSSLDYDSRSGTLSYNGTQIHKFHRKVRRKMFNILWKNRTRPRTGLVGSKRQTDILAQESGLVSSSDDFNQDIAKSVYDSIQEFKKILKNKPAEIKNGYILEITD